MRLILAGVWLLFAGSALAGEAGYPYDLPKQNPAAIAAWHKIVANPLRSQSWVYDFDGVAGPNRLLTLSGKHYVLGSVCKPHDCYDNQVAFLIAADGSRAVGRIARWQGRPGSDLGNPTPRESALLARRISDPNGDPTQAGTP